MSTFYRRFLVIAMALFFYSCNNDPSVKPDPDPSDKGPCRVIEMSRDSELLIFKYDEAFRIDSILVYDKHELIHYSFIKYIDDYTVDIYSSRVSLIDDSLVPHDLPERLEFDIQGRLVKHSFLDNTIGWPPQEVEPYVHDFDTLIYNESGKLVEVQHWNSQEDPGQHYLLNALSTVVMDNSFNIVSVNYKNLRWGEETNYYYTYDDKRRITDDPIILNLLYSGGDHIEGEYISQNNILSETSEDGNESNFNYTYNEDGRPSSITEYGETIKVTYKGCN